VVEKDRDEHKEENARASLRRAFEAHYGRLLRMSVLVSGSREAAEDLVQETFTRSAGRIGTIPEAEQWPYLRTAALNIWRNRKRRLSLERRWRPEAPEADTLSYEDSDEVWEAVRRLPARQRACVVLRFYEDLTERDAASALGCSVGTVKSQTSHALARLRKELEP
jgi:RNA polymerase sigma-70 factor (sigma-E family)